MPLRLVLRLRRAGDELGVKVTFEAALSAEAPSSFAAVTSSSAASASCQVRFSTGRKLLWVATGASGVATCSRPSLPWPGRLRIDGIFVPAEGGKIVSATTTVLTGADTVRLGATVTREPSG